MMRLPWQRGRVPDRVRAAVPLVGAERVMAAARGDDGGYLIASDRALYLVAASADPAQTRRMRWDLIDKATWEPPVLAIDVRVDADQPPARVVFDLGSVTRPGDDRLPATVRDRVTNSIVVNSRIDVPGGNARVLARRNPDTGLLEWRVVCSAGVNPEDPQVRSAADAELADLRSRLGV